MLREYAGSSWRMKELIQLNAPHARLTYPIEHLWDIMFWSIRSLQIAPQTVQALNDALVQIWEEIRQDTIRCLIRSMLRHCQECTQARGGNTNYWVPFWVAAMTFQQNGLACCIIFSLWFSGGSLNSALCRLIILISIKRCGLLSFLTNYPVHISIDVQHDISPIEIRRVFKVFLYIF